MCMLVLGTSGAMDAVLFFLEVLVVFVVLPEVSEREVSVSEGHTSEGHTSEGVFFLSISTKTQKSVLLQKGQVGSFCFCGLTCR